MARATEKKLVQIPLSGGINQSVDERDAPTGTLVKATNVRVKRSLPQKRPGHSAVSLANADTAKFAILGNASGTNVLKEPAMLGSIGDVPVLATTSGVLWAEHEDSGTPWFTPGGFISTAKPISQRSHIWDGGTNSVLPTYSSSAVSESGYRAIGWTTIFASSLTVEVVAPNGKPIGTWRGSATSCCAVVVFAQHDVFYVIYTSDNKIKVVTLTPANGSLTASSAVNLALTSGVPGTDTIMLDVCVLSQSRYWVAIGQQNVDGVNVLDCSGTTVTTSVGFVLPIADNSAPSVYLWYDADFAHVWLSYTYFDPGPSIYKDAYLLYAIDGTFTVDGSGVYDNGVRPWKAFAYGRFELTANNTESTAFGVRGTNVFGGTTLTWEDTAMEIRVSSQNSSSWVTQSIPNCFPVSKPDNHGRVWVVIWDSRFPQSNNETTATYWYALLRLRAEKTTGTAVTIAPTVELNVGPFPVICQNGSYINTLSELFSLVLSRNGDQAVGADFTTYPLLCNLGSVLDLREVTYSTAEQDPHFQIAYANPTSVTAGQATEHFGGNAGIDAGTTKYVLGAAECGFAQKPRILDIPAQTVADETRSFVAVFRWADAYGRAHRSAPSTPLEISGAVPTQLLVSTPTIGQRVDWSGLGFSPLVELYATTDGGQTYHFVNVKALSTPYQSTVTFDVVVNDATDTVLEAGAFVYTDGGVIENWIPPSSTFHVFSDDRLCVGGGFDPRVLTFSKIIVPQESIQFTASEAFQVVVPRDVTGLAFMDGSVIAFTADGIYQVSGQGPNDQGIGEFSEPTLIWGGVGCVSYKSVVRTQLGILFLSPQGFCLLPRGLGQPQFIGSAVRSETDSLPTCLGAVVSQTATYNRVMFLMAADGDTSGTTRLVYDIDRQIWFKDSITFAASEIGLWPDQVTMLREDLTDTDPNALWLEDETLSADNGVAFSQIFESAWVYPFNQGGYGHFRKCQISYELLGIASTMLLSVQIDGNAAETHTWTDSGAAGDIIYHELGIIGTQGGCCKVTLTESGSYGVRMVACVFEVDDDGGIRLLDPSLRA